MEYVTLSNGIKMPILGFGVFQIDDLELCEKTVSRAIQYGYRLFDTARSYQNEVALGRAIKKSGIPRTEFFITSKVFLNEMSYEGCRKAVMDSLENLETDYLDLFLIHMPFGDYYGAYRALVEFYKKGIVKAIGVSNFLNDRLYDLYLHFDVPPMVNQIECHPHSQRIEELSFLTKLNIQLEGWAPFSEGMKGMFEEPILKELAAKHQKTVAQIILRWNIQRRIITIAKTVHENRMEENMAVFDFELDLEDMNKIASLNRNIPSMLDVTKIEEIDRIYHYSNNPILTTLKE